MCRHAGVVGYYPGTREYDQRAGYTAEDDEMEEDQNSDNDDTNRDFETRQYKEERTAALQLREQQLNQAALQAQHQISFLQHQLSSSQHFFNNLNDGVQSGEQKNGDNATKFKQLEQQQLEQQRQYQQQLLLRIQDQLNRLQNQ